MNFKKYSRIDLSDRKPLRHELWKNPITIGAFCSPNKPYQICKQCVMDTTDPTVLFNEAGICSYCEEFSETMDSLISESRSDSTLTKIVATIKNNSKKQSEYDCVLGISGGVDSSYLALMVKNLGLHPLIVHVDTGWNTNVANENINKIVNYLNTDLYTKVIDWESLRNTQIAFLKSGLANIDTPQDHVIFKSIYDICSEFKIQYILSGSNYATEIILPEEWGYDAMDGYQIKKIIKQFGNKSSTYISPLSYLNFYFNNSVIKGIKTFSPLNFVQYSKSKALKILNEQIGWQDYGEKHFESIWTKYFQGYFLPYRFGYDKRKAHYSSLILSQQMSRDEALKKLSKSSFTPDELIQTERFICKKLEITSTELDYFKNISLAHYSDYENKKRSKFFYSTVFAQLQKLSKLLR